MAISLISIYYPHGKTTNLHLFWLRCQLELPCSVLLLGRYRASSAALSGYWTLARACSVECLKCKSPAGKWPRGKRMSTLHLPDSVWVVYRAKSHPVHTHSYKLFLTSWRVAIENTELHNFSTMVFPLYCDKKDSKITLVLAKNWTTSTKT